MKNIILPDKFVPGEIYTNDQIFKWFGVANSGGIRPSIGEKGKLEYIVLMTTKRMQIINLLILMRIKLKMEF